MASDHITSWQIAGETVERVTDYFGELQITEDDGSHKKTLTPWKKSYEQPRQHIKKQRHYFANRVPTSQIYRFSSSYE